MKPAVKFLSRGVQPPSQIYVSSTDSLAASVASELAPESVTVSYRLLRYDGELVYGQFVARTTANRTSAVTAEPLAEGFLLSVSCRAEHATTRGETFARIFLTNPALGTNEPSYMLFADYVTTVMAPAHPNGRVLSSVEGPGWVHLVGLAAPVAGSDWFQLQPTNTRWKLLALLVDFTTGAAVANRNISLSLVGEGVEIWRGWGNQTVPANTPTQLSGGDTFLPAPLTLAFVGISFPSNVILWNAGGLGTATVGIQPADQWGAPKILVEEWLDNV